MQNKAFYWAVTFLKELAAKGLKHAVISPGSRSTPLVLAAASLPQLKKHVILDERSAAFLALGIGKAANTPAALICTSGTAVANYFPAVIEAKKSGVPLLLLTADRPPQLQGTGANQTINQQHIFGEFPVDFQDTGLPSTKKNDLESLKKLAVRSFDNSIKKHGPVHLNFPFQKPLEPGRQFLQSINKKNQKSVQERISTVDKKDLKCFHFNKKIVQLINTSGRPLIIVGQLAPSTKLIDIYELAKQLNAPVLSEQGVIDPDFFIQGFDGFLRNERNLKALEPDLIFRFGRQPASKSLLEAIKNWQPKKHIYLSETGQRSEIENAVTDCMEWKGKSFNNNSFHKKDSKWLQKWKEAEYDFNEMKKTALEHNSDLTDGYIYQTLSPAIPEDWFVFISNSLPARDQSLFGEWKTQNTFTNRGASGIDGITSTAMGVNIGLNEPGVLFIGDLAFLHDTNALLNKKVINEPLIIIVINNQGGSLFRMLPITEHKQHFTPYFETPQEANIAELAAAYDLKAKTVKTIKELKILDLKKMADQVDSKLQIIECQTNPDASMKLRNKLWNFEL